jgi:hypothetical protein
MQPEVRVREGQAVIINSIRCHSVSQIAALLHRQRWEMLYRDEGISAVGCVPSAAASRAKVRPRHTGRAWRSNWPTVLALMPARLASASCDSCCSRRSCRRRCPSTATNHRCIRLAILAETTLEGAEGRVTAS